MGNFPTYTLPTEEENNISKAGIIPYLNSKIFSNKFRKSSPTLEFAEDIKKRIIDTVKVGKPLRFTIPTGGYKKWQLESAPSVNWAELFHLRFMFEYLAPILAAYEPGCILDYYSNDWLIKNISYYPQNDLDEYANSFRDLIKKLAPMFPKNLIVRYKRTADQLNEDELMRRILQNRPKIEKVWLGLSDEEKKEKLKYSERNMRWDILEKDKPLSIIEHQKYIFEGKIIHDAAMAGGWNSDLEYLRTDNAIPIIHRKDPYFLHLATAKGSSVQFWVGTGIIEIINEVYIPRIMSINQYDQIEGKLTIQSVKGIGLRNFETIQVFDE